MNDPKDASEPGEAAVLRSPMVVAADVMKTFCFNFTFNLEVCSTILRYIDSTFIHIIFSYLYNKQMKNRAIGEFKIQVEDERVWRRALQITLNY